MTGFLLRAAIVALGLWLASMIVPGVTFASPGVLVAAALLLGFINAFIRPILVILTFPITIVTLGLFLLIINGLMVELVAHLLPGFGVSGFWAALFTSIVVSLTSWATSKYINAQGRVEPMPDPRTIELRRGPDGRYG